MGCAKWGSDIVVAKADGSDPAPIYPPGSERPKGAQDVNPAWSPDGTSIAFTRIPAPPSVYTEPRQPQAIWVAQDSTWPGARSTSLPPASRR